jgi:hypothetical protein
VSLGSAYPSLPGPPNRTASLLAYPYPRHSSLLGFSSGHFSRPRFYFALLTAHSTLFRELFAIFFPSLCLALVLYPPESSLLRPTLWGNLGRVSLIGHERGARLRQKRYQRHSSPQNARTWNQETIQWRHPSLARVCLMFLRPSRAPLLPFVMYKPPSDIVTTDTPPRQLLCRICICSSTQTSLCNRDHGKTIDIGNHYSTTAITRLDFHGTRSL